MGLALSGVGYDDALFVDNGAYTRVRTIARAIERTPSLANAYAAGGLNAPDIRAFLKACVGADLNEIRTFAGLDGAAGLSKAERAARRTMAKSYNGREVMVGAAHTADFWNDLRASGKKGKYPKLTTVSPAARQAIADLLGVGAAYARAAARKGAGNKAVISSSAGRQAGKYGKGHTVWAKGAGAKYIPRDERRSRREAAAAGVLMKDSSAQALAEKRRAAARLALGEGYLAKSSRERAELMAQHGSAARLPRRGEPGFEQLRGQRQAAFEASIGGVRPYGASLKTGAAARKMAKKDARAATGTGSVLSRDAEVLKQRGVYLTAKGQPYVKRPNGQSKFISYDEARRILGGAVSNPFGFLSADDFGAVALSNPLIGASTDSTGINLFDSLEAGAANLGGLPGKIAAPIAALAAPVAFGVGASAVHLLVVPKILAWDKTPDWIKPYAYTVTGSLVGVAAGVASTGMKQHPQARAATQLVGGAAALVGVGIDLYRNNFFGLLGGRSSDTAGIALSGEMGDSDDDEGEFGGLALSGDFAGLALSGNFGAVALSGDLGDGGAYQIQPVGMDSALGAMHQHYADAMYGDAAVCGSDLSEAEGNAALAGVGAFFGTFGQTPHSTMRVNLGTSRHAGRAGHRWGWLIKLVGFAEFQRIVALPPADRCAVIEQMRVAAIEAAKGGLAKQQARMLASQSVEAPEALGPRGVTSDYANADAFGALMVSGPGGL